MKIFISYRRDDSQIASQSIYEALVKEIGFDQVFFDIDDIPYGVNFKTHLDRVVSECGIMLVMIGPDWSNATDAKGQRRLDDPTDFVRIEVESAIERGLTVIPVLLKGARMPSADELPDSLKEFTFLNAAVVEWGADLRAHRERLFKVIRRLRGDLVTDETNHVTGAREGSSAGGGFGDRWLSILLVTILAIGIGWFVGNPSGVKETAEAGMAVDLIHKVPKTERDLPAATLNELGQTASKADRYALAAARYQLAIKKKPDYTRAYANLAHSLNKLKRFDDAIVVGKKGIGTASERQYLHVCSLHNEIAKALEGRNDIDLAIKRYRLAEASARNAKDAASKALATAEGDTRKLKRAEYNVKGADKYLKTYRRHSNAWRDAHLRPSKSGYRMTSATPC